MHTQDKKQGSSQFKIKKLYKWCHGTTTWHTIYTLYSVGLSLKTKSLALQSSKDHSLLNPALHS